MPPPLTPAPTAGRLGARRIDAVCCRLGAALQVDKWGGRKPGQGERERSCCGVDGCNKPVVGLLESGPVREVGVRLRQQQQQQSSNCVQSREAYTAGGRDLVPPPRSLRPLFLARRRPLWSLSLDMAETAGLPMLCSE